VRRSIACQCRRPSADFQESQHAGVTEPQDQAEKGKLKDVIQCLDLSVCSLWLVFVVLFIFTLSGDNFAYVFPGVRRSLTLFVTPCIVTTLYGGRSIFFFVVLYIFYVSSSFL